MIYPSSCGRQKTSCTHSPPRCIAENKAVRENRRISGREADFDAVVRENKRNPGRETNFNEAVRKTGTISGLQTDFEMLRRKAQIRRSSPWSELLRLLCADHREHVNYETALYGPTSETHVSDFAYFQIRDCLIRCNLREK